MLTFRDKVVSGIFEFVMSVTQCDLPAIYIYIPGTKQAAAAAAAACHTAVGAKTSVLKAEGSLP